MAELKLTKAGFTKLEQELDRIQKKELPSIKKRMVSARADGDLSENNAWITAKEEMDVARFRVAELKKMLRDATLVVKQTKSKTVNIGDTVTIQIGTQKMKVTIVSTLEADPQKQLISQESPLGKILHGKEVGETVALSTPGGAQKVKILDKE